MPHCMSRPPLPQPVVATCEAASVNGRTSALPVRGAAGAGALVRGAAGAGALAGRTHPPGVLRHRVPGPCAVRRVPLPARRRPALPHARAAVAAIMLAPVAVGVVSGTILSFEFGLLWPAWMQDFGNGFGLGFTLEGFSFFLEAIIIGVYGTSEPG